MGLPKPKRHQFLSVGVFLVFFTVVMTVTLFRHATQNCSLCPSHQRSYDRKTTPLIFIGGWPRSGTTLMRAIVDAHPDVRCGEETEVIHMTLSQLLPYRSNPNGRQHLLEAGITDEVLYSALGKFILEIVVGHAEPAPRLCNKDPLVLNYMPELVDVFPLGRFLLMIRDGRACCHSVASRRLGVPNKSFDPMNATQCLERWNRSVKKMYGDCLELGESKCFVVRYEQLVLHPRAVLGKILEFLGVAWNEVVLHHETQINKPGGISLSRLEASTDQVIKPVNLDALTKWANFVPDEVRRQMRQIAPMLETLGYDPDAYPPNYGRPDKEVEENTLLVQKNKILFEKLEWEVLNRTKLLLH